MKSTVRAVSTVVIVLLLTVGILGLAYAVGESRTAAAASKQETTTASATKSTDTASTGNAQTNNQTKVIMLQNFVGVDGEDVRSFSTEELEQFGPALDKANEVISRYTGGTTFDIVGEPKFEKLGENGTSVVVYGNIKTDGTGEYSIDDIWQFIREEQ